MTLGVVLYVPVSSLVGLSNDGLISSFNPFVSGLALAKVFHTTVAKLVHG
jgi:hypothetical protein